MGGTNSTPQTCETIDYLRYFHEVETKRTWKVGLIIEIIRKCKLIVTEIQPVQLYEKPLLFDSDHIIYYYRGTRVHPPGPTQIYKIVMRRIPDVRIGGNKSSPLEKVADDVKIDDEPVDFTKSREETVDKCPCSENVDVVEPEVKSEPDDSKSGACDSCGEQDKKVGSAIPVQFLDDNIADD